MNYISVLAALVLSSSAAPTCSFHPTVHVRNGTLIGTTSEGIDSFFGIPYVKAPVGSLRLRAPQSIDQSFGSLTLPTSLEKVTACPQMDLSAFDLDGLVPEEYQSYFENVSSNFTGISGEDCLTINIQRPANLSPDKKYPVLFWVYGGGWEIGTTQWYQGSPLLKLSMSMNEPIIFVSVNYRLNAFGFLQGKEMQAEGITNLGLRDQRKGLEWVAENIESFGGDPDRVTIWGESAGGASVFDHLTVNNGDHTYNGKPLFHAAIMNSGSIIRTLNADSTKAQDVFDSVAANAGCKASTFKNGADVLECLRKIPYKTFRHAMNSVPNYASSRSNDLSYIRRADTSSIFYSQDGDEAVRSGKYAHVPVIMGNMEDEATVFTPSQYDIVNSTETLIDYIASWWPEAPRAAVAEFVHAYPDNPSAGLPTGTGDKYEFYPQQKRNAAIQSDTVFIMGRRIALSFMAAHVPAWSYLATYEHDLPYWGTYHTSDLAAQFGLRGNTAVAAKMQDEAYIHFVNHHNPNGEEGHCEEWWPKWTNEHLQMANFSKSAVGLTKDNFRWKSYEIFKREASFKQ